MFKFEMINCSLYPRIYADKVQVPFKFSHSCVESGYDIGRYSLESAVCCGIHVFW